MIERVALGRTMNVAIVIGLAALAVSCTQHNGAGTATAPRTSTTVSQASRPAAGDCGNDASAPDRGVLSTQDVWAASGDQSRSVRTVELNGSACAQGSTPLSNSCDTSGFPWTTSTEASARDLYGAGVRRWIQATLNSSDGMTLKEHILVPAAEKSSGVVDTYRKHLESCGAKVLSSQNGKKLQMVMPGSPELAVSFQGGKVIALQGYGSHWKSGQLANVLGTAENRSAGLSAQ
jgi:hypothetical protein